MPLRRHYIEYEEYFFCLKMSHHIKEHFLKVLRPLQYRLYIAFSFRFYRIITIFLIYIMTNITPKFHTLYLYTL